MNKKKLFWNTLVCPRTKTLFSDLRLNCIPIKIFELKVDTISFGSLGTLIVFIENGYNIQAYRYNLILKR